MASVPERREVLSRLGVIKGNNDDLFPRSIEPRMELEASVDGDEALESLPAEGGAAALIARVVDVAANRKALLLLVGVSGVCVFVLAALFAVREAGNSAAPRAVTPEVTSETTSPAPAATPTNTPAATLTNTPTATSTNTPTATSTKRAVPVAKRAASLPPTIVKSRVPAGPASIARQPITPSRPGNLRDAGASQALDARPTVDSEIPIAAVPSSTDVIATGFDNTLYSKDDEDVRPPRLLSESLPSPTIGGWTTRTNVIEVIVSETGAVERARFIAAPQRMPDTFVLSRAKVWKFSPAMKDGRPVRYRLLLSWEVNP